MATRINKTGLVPAECEPIDVGKVVARWFYVGRGMCQFLGPGKDGATVEVDIPTKTLQRALCRMELQLGKQRKLRKRKPKRRREPRS